MKAIKILALITLGFGVHEAIRRVSTKVKTSKLSSAYHFSKDKPENYKEGDIWFDGRKLHLL